MPLFAIAPEEASYGVTKRDLLRLFFKHWLSVFLCLLLVGLATWGAVYIQPPLYESSAKVWIQTEQQGTLSFLSTIAAHREIQATETLSRKIETEMQLLMARSSAEAVVDRLGISKDQLIQPPIEYLLRALPKWLQPSDKKTAQQTRNETVDLFLKSIYVEPLRSKTAETTSTVLAVRFDSTDKALAARALEALLDAYVQFGLQHNRDLGESTYRLIDAKIQESTAEVDALDDRILALTVDKTSRPDVSAPGTNAAAHDGADPLSATLASGRSGSSSLGLLKQETIEMQTKLEEEQQLFTDDSPNVQHLKEQLSALKERLNSGVRASTQLDSEIERLERLRGMALARFGELRSKRDQIEMYLQLNPLESDSRLITEAPIQPDKQILKLKILIGILGPFAGLFLGLLIAGLSEYFDRRLDSVDDAKRYLGLEILGSVPTLKRTS